VSTRSIGFIAPVAADGHGERIRHASSLAETARLQAL